MSIIVFGSINMDLVARTPRLPAPGETLTGLSFATVPGGKGANQAVACGRLAAPTFMVGRVGGGAFGGSLLQSLQQSGVDTSQVLVDEEVTSGVAVIAVDDHGENNIIVIPGANGRVGQADLGRLQSLLPGAELLLLQLEIPMEAVVAAARMARQAGVGVILDPAPARSLPAELFGLVDIMTPNETEAGKLAGEAVVDVDSAARAARALVAKGARQVVVKMGSAGAYVEGQGDDAISRGPCRGRCRGHYPALPVEAVDTVAAGDAFNGALAVALAEGKPFDQAMHWALAGGACAVTKEGAQPSMPDRQALFARLSAG